MIDVQNDTILKLRKEMLILGGIKSPSKEVYKNKGLDFMRDHLPNGCFPTGAVHEFVCPSPESMASSMGFIAALNTSFFSRDAVMAWISSDHQLFPPAFTAFTLKPHHMLCIHPSSAKEAVWVTEEALRCKGLNAVISELNGFDFTQSRRFQLAVESSGATGFIMNTTKSGSSNNACVGRWQIESMPSRSSDDLPGVGSPAWRVSLDKMRNGKKGIWNVVWNNGLLQLIEVSRDNDFEQQQKWAV